MRRRADRAAAQSRHAARSPHSRRHSSGRNGCCAPCRASRLLLGRWPSRGKRWRAVSAGLRRGRWGSGWLSRLRGRLLALWCLAHQVSSLPKLWNVSDIGQASSGAGKQRGHVEEGGEARVARRRAKLRLDGHQPVIFGDPIRARRSARLDLARRWWRRRDRRWWYPRSRQSDAR